MPSAVRIKTTAGWQDLAVEGGSIAVYEQASEPDSIEVGDLWIDTDETPPAWAPTVPLVTALPGSPFDGQECYYQSSAMATLGVVWHFRYRAASASAYKWECLGGPPMTVGVAGATAATSSASLVDLGGPSFTLPLAGDWLGQASCMIVQQSAVQSYNAGFQITGLGLYCGTMVTGAGNGWVTMIFGQHSGVNIASGTVLRMDYYTSAGSMAFQNRWMRILPVRVG